MPLKCKIMKKYALLAIFTVIGVAVLSAQTETDKRAMREARAEKTYESTKALLESQKYEFIADRLISSTGFSKSLVTTPNNIRIAGDQADVYLPYYGELRANTPYVTDGGIKFEGKINDYRVEFRDHKRRAVIKFNIDKGIEDHNFILTIARDGSTRATVISSGRTTISYYGIIRAPEADSDF